MAPLPAAATEFIELPVSFRKLSARCALAAVAAAFAPLPLAAAGAQTSSRPNVVLIVADDLGYQLGCYGDKVARTPNLDRLAADGTRFTRAYCTTASCSASRSVLMTGLYNHAIGHYGHSHGYSHFSTYESVRSLPVLLAEAGYRSCLIGKIPPGAGAHLSLRDPASGGDPGQPQHGPHGRERQGMDQGRRPAPVLPLLLSDRPAPRRRGGRLCQLSQRCRPLCRYQAGALSPGRCERAGLAAGQRRRARRAGGLLSGDRSLGPGDRRAARCAQRDRSLRRHAGDLPGRQRPAVPRREDHALRAGGTAAARRPPAGAKEVAAWRPMPA